MEAVEWEDKARKAAQMTTGFAFTAGVKAAATTRVAAAQGAPQGAVQGC